MSGRGGGRLRRRRNWGSGRRGRCSLYPGLTTDLQRRQRCGDDGEGGDRQRDGHRSAASRRVGHDTGDPLFQGLGVRRHGCRSLGGRGAGRRVGGQANQGLGVEMTIHGLKGGGVCGLFRPGGQVGVQTPDQRVEPEQSQGQARQDQKHPVVPPQVRQFVGQYGGCGLTLGQTGRVDQDDAGRRAPAKRTGGVVGRYQRRFGAARQALQVAEPGGALDGAALAGPAVQRQHAQRQPSRDQHHAQQPDGGGQMQGRGPGQTAGHLDAGQGRDFALPHGKRQIGRRRDRRQNRQIQRREQGRDDRQGQQQADRGAKNVHALGRAAGQQVRTGKASACDQAGLHQHGDEDGPDHDLRPRASSMARSSASASSAVILPPMPSRAVAALAADPAKKVSTIRCRAPAATASVRGTGL